MLKKKHIFLCLVIFNLTLHHTAISFAASPIQELSPSYDLASQEFPNPSAIDESTRQDIFTTTSFSPVFYADLYQYIEIIPHDAFYTVSSYPYVEMIPRYDQLKDAFYNSRYFTESGLGSAVQKRNNNPINCSYGFTAQEFPHLSAIDDPTRQDIFTTTYFSPAFYAAPYRYIELIPHDAFYTVSSYPYVEMIPRYDQLKNTFYNSRYFTESGLGSAVQKRNNNPINCSYGFTAQEFPHLSAIDDPTRQDIFTTTYFSPAFYAAPYQYIELIPRSEQLKDAFYDNREFIESHLDFTMQKRGNHPIFIAYESTYRDFFKNYGTTERERQHPLTIGDHIPQDIVSITYYSPEFYTNGYEDIEMLLSYFLQKKGSKFYRSNFAFGYYPFENKKENKNTLYTNLSISPLGEIKYTNVNYDAAAPSTILAKNWYTALPPVHASASDSLIVNNKYGAYSYREDMEDAHLLPQELSNAYYPKVRSIFLQNRTDFQRLVDLLKQKRGARAFTFFYHLSAGYGISRNLNDRHFYYRFFGSYEPPTNLQSRTLYFSVNPDLPQSIEELIEGAQDIEQFIMAHHKNGAFSPISNIGQVTYKCIVNTNEENNPAYHVNFKFAQAQTQSILVELEYTSTDIPLHAEHASYVRLAPHWYYKLSKYRRSADFWN